MVIPYNSEKIKNEKAYSLADVGTRLDFFGGSPSGQINLLTFLNVSN
jgi:hypothetical protein